MNQTTLSIDNPCALMANTTNPASCPAPLKVDAQALTDRSADFGGLFTPPRRESLDTTTAYTALTERPADFESPFASPRRQRIDAAPTYNALTKRPGETPTDESTALKVPPSIEHIAA